MSEKPKISWYHKMLNHNKLSTSLISAIIASLSSLYFTVKVEGNLEYAFSLAVVMFLLSYTFVYNILVLLYENRTDVADRSFKRSLASFEKGDYFTSVKHCKKSIHLYRQILGTEDTFGLFYEQLGDAYYEKGDYKRALKALKKANFLYRKTSEEDEDIARSYILLGHSYAAQGDYDNGIRAFQKGLSIQQRILPADHENIANTQDFLKEAARRLKEKALS